jgi:DNA-3-methyladenine glycosylase II
LYLLQPEQPFSFTTSLKRLLNMPRQIVARVEPGPAGPVYVRALEQGARLGLVRVWEEGGALAVDIRGDLVPEQTLAQVRRSMGLDLDLGAVHEHMAAADPVMAGLFRKYAGARPIVTFTHWEALAWSIIGQQINIAFAFSLKESLCRIAGAVYNGYPAFPEPERVAAIPYEALQAAKFTRRKAEYIVDIARAIAEGRLDLPRLAGLPYEEAVPSLVKLRGVGRWTAECLLMDAGAPDAFPAGDIGIRNAIQQFYGLDHQPTEPEVRELGRPWAPYSALACYYLWLGLLDKGP